MTYNETCQENFQMVPIKLFWNFWIRNESLPGLAEKQVVNND